METKIIKNVSKGFLKKLFSKEIIEGISLYESGFVIIMAKEGEIKIPFENIQAVKTNFYFDKIAAYRTIIIVTKDSKEYSLNISSDVEESNYILKHYANYQLGGEIPEDIKDINVILQYGLNDYNIRLENGNLIETKKGTQTTYPLENLEYYRIDKPSNLINLKFKDKKLFVTLSVIHVTNLWLIVQILEKFSTKK